MGVANLSRILKFAMRTPTVLLITDHYHLYDVGAIVDSMEMDFPA